MRFLVAVALAAAASAQSPLALEDLERRALENNPTLAQAESAVESYRARAKQAGQYPNPVVGATGDELSPNPTFRGGEVGMFVEQRIVTGGKLTFERRAALAVEEKAGAAREAQLWRVRTAVRRLFYHALAAEREVAVAERLAAIAEEAAGVTAELANVGQADRPDLLEAEIEAQSAAMALDRERLEQRRIWREIAAVTGDRTLAGPHPLEGDLEQFPRIDADQALERILTESPEIEMALAERRSAEARIAREKAEVIPDVEVHGGFRNSPFIGVNGRPIGREGFFDVGVEIPVFDRNRGAIQAAKADAARADQEAERLRLRLATRLAYAFERYGTAAATADRYRDEMLPRAREAERLYAEGFQRMAAAYPQVLIARRRVAQLERGYVEALEAAWDAAAEIEGMLLTDGLAAPLE